MKDEIFESEAERAWSESTALHGVHPDLMSARQGDLEGHQPGREAAALMPALIPIAALMTGPLVAAFIALMTDGRPPKLRQAMAIFSIGLGAWFCRQGLIFLAPDPISPRQGALLTLLLMLGSGAALWVIYTFWQKGRRLIDRQTINSSIIVIIALSCLYWMGRSTTWWIWLGR